MRSNGRYCQFDDVPPLVSSNLGMLHMAAQARRAGEKTLNAVAAQVAEVAGRRGVVERSVDRSRMTIQIRDRTRLRRGSVLGGNKTCLFDYECNVVVEWKY
eukprot:SAG11_NODE_4107_length_2062_cov_3.650535_2_plen_101_part_00